MADASPWLEVLGRAHPALLHAPLGVLPAVVLLEFGAVICRRETPRGAIMTLAFLAAITAAVAATSGLLLAGEPGYGGDVTGQHKIAGIVFACLCLISALLTLRQNRTPLRITLAITLLAMLPAGHLGGTLSHGEHFLTEPLQKIPPADASEFVRTIQPILERSCTKCHNAHKKKGELDLSSAAAIAAGGDSGDVIEAGKPDDSELLRLCLLPEDDDDAMPPTGKRPRPSAEDLEVLRQWILNGAKFD